MSARPTPPPGPPPAPAATVMCPHLTCRKVLSVPETARGQVVKCQHCQNLLRVPAATPSIKPADAA